ncbi:MAG: nitronate monooxygenase [Bacillota bacterium]
MKSPICEALGIKYPIFQGAMAWIAKAPLAAAVSEAGGLGIIAASQAPAEYVKDQIQQIRKLTDKPFAVNLMMQSPYIKDVIDLVIAEKVPAVTTGAGNPAPYMERFHAAGIKVIPVIPNVKVAKKMAAAGATAVVAEGMESGGHVGDMTSMALWPQVIDAVDIPVIGAGGVADGRGLASAMIMGCAGVQMGTAFLVAKECGISSEYKERVLAAADTDTVVTGKFLKHAVRSLKNQLTEKYQSLEFGIVRDKPVQEEMENLGTGALRRAVEGDIENGTICAGQIAGMIKEEATCREIIETVIKDAEKILCNAANMVE